MKKNFISFKSCQLFIFISFFFFLSLVNSGYSKLNLRLSSLQAEELTTQRNMQLPWIVYYNDKAKPEAFLEYNPIILDSDAHPQLDLLLAQNKEVLGYISLGEVEEQRPWFNTLKAAGIIIRENMNWKGSWVIDIRSPIWKALLLSEIIPNIFKQGFNGLFYDQLDMSIALEKEDPTRFKGMILSAIDLLKSIHAHFPNKRIMMNRAYEIIPQVGNAIDYVLAESLFTAYDFKNKKYYIRTQEEYKWQFNQLNAARKAFPHLVVFSLDYWPPNDQKMYKKIYAFERAHCLRPYVTTLALDQITPEPQ